MVLPGWWCPAAKKQTHTSYKTQQRYEPQTVSEGRGCGPAINDSIRRGSNNDSRRSQSANNLSWRSERWARNTMPGNWLGKYNFPGIVPPPPPPLPPPYTHFIYCHLWDTHTYTLHTLLYTHGTHQPALGFDERSVLAVHLVVQPAGVAQVVSGAVASPQRRGGGSAVHTLAALWWRTHRDICEALWLEYTSPTTFWSSVLSPNCKIFTRKWWFSGFIWCIHVWTCMYFFSIEL